MTLSAVVKGMERNFARSAMLPGTSEESGGRGSRRRVSGLRKRGRVGAGGLKGRVGGHATVVVVIATIHMGVGEDWAGGSVTQEYFTSPE